MRNHKKEYQKRKEKYGQLNLKLPHEVIKTLNSICQSQGITKAEWIRKKIELYRVLYL